MSLTPDDLEAIRSIVRDELASRPSAPAARQSARPNTGGAVFPNYGRRKNEPVSGAERGDLDYYAAGCRRTLDDPGKSRWHDRERVLLAAIEAEIARQSGGGSESATGQDSFPPMGIDDDLPF